MTETTSILSNGWEIKCHLAKCDQSTDSLIIFLHGASYPAHCMMMTEVCGISGAQAFNNINCDVVFFNFPGFGDSVPTINASMQFNNSNAVDLVFDVFNLYSSSYHSIFVCGLSHGGLIANLFAIKYKHPSLKGLILFEPRVTQGNQFDGIDTSNFYRIIKNKNEIIALWESQRIAAGAENVIKSQNMFTSIGENLEVDKDLKALKSFRVGMWATQMTETNFIAKDIPILWCFANSQAGIFQPSHHLKLSDTLLTCNNIHLIFIPQASHWFFAEQFGRNFILPHIKQFTHRFK